MEQSWTREEALANPDAVNAAISALMGDQTLPVVPEAPGDYVTLPGGLAYAGKNYKTATVRELNGSDEEALSRAIKSGNAFHFIDTILQRGVATIGDVPATPDMLSNMLLGDRDELLIAIRNATYGEDFAIDGWTCPHCGAINDLSFNLATDIERVTLHGYSGEPTIEVPLKKGAVALVKFPTGADHQASSNDPNATNAERNSELLRRCVKTITQADGNVTHVQAFPSTITLLSIPDRRAISAAIWDQQPGPRFSSISFVHQECQKEVTLALSVLDLFRDILVGL